MPEIATLIVVENKHLHDVCSKQGVSISSPNYFGSDVKITPISLTVQTYHKGIDASFDDCFQFPTCVSFNVLLEQAMMAQRESSQLQPMTLPMEARHLELQAQDSTPSRESGRLPFEELLRQVLLKAPGVFSTLEEDWIITQVENFSQLILWSSKCTSFSEYISITQLAYRLFTGKPSGIVIRDKINHMFSPTVQAMDLGEVLQTMRSAFDATTSINESPLVKKLVSMYSFLLTQGFLEKFGLSITDEEYSKLEQRALVGAFSSKKAFFMCVIDTVLFICERLHEYRVTGDMTGLLHSSDKYGAWTRDADRILNLAPFVGNLEAHGTSYFSFLADLDSLLEKGSAYCKYMNATTGTASVYMKKKLSSLQLLKNTEITRRSAAQEREQPMGVLIFGASSVAKSAFTKILFNYYGSLFDLDRGDEFRYVRNPASEYWTGFTTSKWCIQLDDIAFLLPSKSTSIDPTMGELLNVANMVPYCPPQASLEDKGKTPVMAELLLATTNCASLNAREYFWCPLAVRRRLPFVIEVKPKQQYLHENGVFIDPLKLASEEGKFPDFWNITVFKLQPNTDGMRDDATMESVAEFTDINKFLQYYGKACLAHRANQKQAMSKNQDMQTIAVCKTCLAPLPHDTCLQVQFAHWNPLRTLWWSAVSTIASWRYCVSLFELCVSYRYLQYITLSIANCVAPDTLGVRLFGKAMELKRSVTMKRAIMCVSIIGLVFAAYFQFAHKPEKTSIRKEKVEEVFVESDEVDEVSVDDEDTNETPIKYQYQTTVTVHADGQTHVKDVQLVGHDVALQGNLHGTTEAQLEKEDRANVWYNPTVELSAFEMPQSATSLAGISADGVRDLFSSNCVMLEIRAEGELSKRVMRGIFLGGQRCLTNGHAFKEGASKYSVTIIRSAVTEGVSRNVTVTLRREDIAFDNKDSCIFEVFSLPPFKDITKYWNDSDFVPSSGVELMRHGDGSVTHSAVYALQLLNDLPVPELKKNLDIYYGHSSIETEVGMCGSVCVAITPRGPMVIGIHVLGAGNNIGILRLKLCDIKVMLKHSAIWDRPVIQGGGSPMLSCAARQRVLTPLHHRSLVRYLPDGCVNVYGSFSGFRPRPKSKVCATPLQKVFLDHYEREVAHGPPAMGGWEPWRKNVEQMIQPQVVYDRGTLNECINSYVSDVIGALPTGWEKELVELSDTAAVNGLPGVKYIDKLTTTTSMGAPWGCPKKKFLVPAPSELYPEGVDFIPEVWERVRTMESIYASGNRVYPVYTGHLKDEATPLAKCLLKKTRLFSASPVDFNLLVRKKLLSFVRLVQKNKFAFEAAPGLVTQSSEWGDLYRHLTFFGPNRMVGGDYKAFDKGMLADFVLAAFDCIRKIHGLAGYSDETLLTIMGIGFDIAFPVTDVNGDLMEFYGTNPSGHVLTVIVNSIVNSLYVRYCYRVLNPACTLATFREHVRLITYGDDNLMGINLLASWFNHTSIQRVLKSIGVVYTMADKEAESVPYLDISQCSFLKRTWVWNSEVGDWMAPLEEDSIFKSLTMWVPSSSIDKYAQMVFVVSSACNEYFFYGREKFEEKRQFFENVLAEEPFNFYVRESTLPLYDQLVERFHRASLRPVTVKCDDSAGIELSL